MKKITNVISIILVFLSLAIVLWGRKGHPYEVPVTTEYVTVEVTVPVYVTVEPSIPPEVTPEPTPEQTEFVLSFIGDCTLKSFNGGKDYDNKMNGDFSYPFSNVADILAEDEATFGNLECTISDQALLKGGDRTFGFLTPTSYLNILKEGNVDFVNTANNHIDDYGEAGVNDTYAALEAAGIPFCKKNETCIFETQSGIRIGVYCEMYNNNVKNTAQIVDSTVAGIESLKEQDVDIIMAVFHFGNEGKYTVFDSEYLPARAAIDAGATIVYSSHPHVLQPIEEYKDGVIMYSLGNFTFGGNTHPTDPDTAIVQVHLKRTSEGALVYDGYTAVPCCVSSTLPANFVNASGTDYNDYRPTPYEEGSEHYDRVISKLDGTSDVTDFTPDYSWAKS